ncbi:MAG TPA: PilN domain-containing protein [Thermoanaerobaculia bacterium]|nr:PilN domain-containing protein [Thermoanaerobaculia bacterium]
MDRAGGTNINNMLLVVLSVIGIVVALGYWFLEKRKLADREATVAARQTDADRLEAIIKDVEQYQKRKDSLQKRIDLINQLKENQKGPVRIMDQISRDLPDLVWLDRMSITNGSINLSGRGLNPNAIANFVENIKNDPYFEEPELGSMSQASVTPPVYSYDMKFHFTYAPKDGTTGTGGAATGTSGTGTATSTSTAPGSKPTT